jgi:hypothetical protein
MKPNKRDLKAYVRYDGNGRIVPSGVILSRVKPKVGKWVEIDAYECCSHSNYPDIYVCGAGTDEVNGKYTYAGTRNNKPYYIKGTYIISWGEYSPYEDWEIYDSTLFDVWYYYNNSDTLTPDLASGEWYSDDGELPSPSVELSACPTFPIFICVSELEFYSELNGTYTYIELSEGKPHYQMDGNLDIYWHNGQWWVSDVIYSNDDVADPTLVTTWVGTGGSLTIIEGVCPTTTTTTTVEPTTTTTTTLGG